MLDDLLTLRGFYSFWFPAFPLSTSLVRIWPESPSLIRLSQTRRKRFGTKAELVKQLLAFCQSRDEYKYVVKECETYSAKGLIITDIQILDEVEIGYVCLVKSGRYYKIGHSNAAGRRTYELDLKLPEKTKTIHAIRTDDPPGIESYWHNRFVSKRMNGEWFDLGSAEVAAFKRRKVM